ncbi:SIR2 family protein [Cellulosimicrobium cellulans]|uniref:SIR2 family protein n=1 Tax=Cellulosimicrobium cellulans TaxID=1710 RepID=UPI00214A7A42|nr:SIR2 family protein [Cellulosimicrobium cellulans]
MRRAAVADGADDEAARAAFEDPESWWSANGSGELTYSSLLEAAGGPTPAARRAVLDEYFTLGTTDANEQSLVPSAAHRAIARLVVAGYIRVILTTNFDNLTERALIEAGVTPQVITRPEQVPGMEPLAHARATVIKLHGDFTELATRNTIDELATYPDEWDQVLDRVNAEYGLIICGWSGESDTALVSALSRSPMRRYPLFWDARSGKSRIAGPLLAQHRGLTVPAVDADELFGGLIRSVESLDQMTQPPLTTALALATLKKTLSDPTRSVELRDLVLDAARASVESARERLELPTGEGGGYGAVLAAHRIDAEPVLALLTAGVFYDRANTHGDIWIEALRRLMGARDGNANWHDEVERARLYPSVLALRAMGIIAVAQDRDQLLLDLLTRTRFSDWSRSDISAPAMYWLHDWYALDHDAVKALSRWNGQRWIYPMSPLLREDLRSLLSPYFGSAREYDLACDDYEYLLALIQHLHPDLVRGLGVASGFFMGERQWANMKTSVPGTRLRERLQYLGDSWPLWKLLGGPESATTVLDDFDAKLFDRFIKREF